MGNNVTTDVDGVSWRRISFGLSTVAAIVIVAISATWTVLHLSMASDSYAAVSEVRSGAMEVRIVAMEVRLTKLALDMEQVKAQSYELKAGIDYLVEQQRLKR